ncbi:cytochrome P450 [Aspergillus spectabilis]
MEDKNGPPHNLETGEIVAETSIMGNAGSDTMASALKNPQFQGQKPSYLRACLDESLRMLPPVIFGLPRLTPPEGTTILGEFLPGDTSVSMSAYVVHNDESIFKDHNVYRLERWLGEAGKSLQPYFISCSTVAQGCIGRNISHLEQTVLLDSLVHRYDIALSSPDWDPPIPEATNLSPGPMPPKIWRIMRIE